jgi:hypothetical protein
MRQSIVAGASTLTGINLGVSNPDIYTHNFEAVNDEYSQFAFAMPKKWNEGTLTFKLFWSHDVTTVNFGVVWQMQAVAVGDGETMATSFGTPVTVTDTGGTTNALYVTAETSALTVAGTITAEDMVFFRVGRLATDPSDTLAIDARLHGVTVYITTDAGTDA